MFWPFKRKLKSVLGVDIGSSLIKVVELSKLGEKENLENYGFVSISSFYEKNFEKKELSSRETGEILGAILKEAKIKTREVFFSLPDFVTLFTTFLLPPMSKEEIPQAVRFEARRHIPLPLKEVTFDWNVISGKPPKEELEILLVALSNETIDYYQKIAEISNLELLSLEAEVFGLQRSLIKEKNTIGLIDIGTQSTTCSIVDENILKTSHSFDFASNQFTGRISKSLNVDYKTAEDLKQKNGLVGDENVKRALLPLVDLLILEIKKISESFYQKKGKEVKKYILAGGSALLPGLKEYFAKNLEKEVQIANPFSDLSFPPILKETLEKLGPSFSVAIGTAMKGFK